MAFKKVEISRNCDTPFFDQWQKGLSQNTKESLVGVLLAPTYLIPVKSGKGYIANFSEVFMTFIWKNSTSGKYLKELLIQETGALPLIVFSIGGFNLDYSLGIDEDYEVILETDQGDGTPLVLSITNGTYPISPNENRKSIFELPKILVSPPANLSTTKTKPK